MTDVPSEKRDKVWAEIAEGIHQAIMTFNSATKISNNRVVSSSDFPVVTLTGILSVKMSWTNH